MLKRICVVLLLLGAGCASPIGVTRVGIQSGYREITANTLIGSTLSDDTRALLRRYELLEVYGNRPADALAQLHEIACANMARDILFALAEASYGAARQFDGATWVRLNGKMVPGADAVRMYDMSAAIYAYLYLFSPETSASLYDPHARIACSIYNCGLASALAVEGSKEIKIRSRVVQLPFGTLTVEATRPGFPWNEKQFSQFVASDKYLLRGLSSRTREPGLGAPLIAIPNKEAFGKNWPSYYSKKIILPATAFLRVHGSLRDLSGDGLNATLELYCPYNVTETTVNNQTVPLEADLTAPLAYGLEGSEMWSTEVSQFLSGNQLIKTSVYLTQPYERGKIPVVFVHGTSGSPGRWAELLNDLMAAPQIRQRYQFWYFIYNSGQPIPYSAMLFRESLDSVVKDLDPAGADAALRQMVIIGHSQGGIVTRLAIVSSENHFWKNFSDKSPEEFKAAPETLSLLKRASLFEPSPYIARVVFMCTPHRGSFRISNVVNKLTAFLVKMPGDVFRAGTDIITSNPDAVPRELRKGFQTSVAAMKPGSRFLDALEQMPFDEKVKRHTIAAVLPGQDIPTGNDGVVEYKGAHLDNVESEVVVRHRHSCQGHPATVREITRILMLHLPPTGQ